MLSDWKQQGRAALGIIRAAFEPFAAIVGLAVLGVSLLAGALIYSETSEQLNRLVRERLLDLANLAAIQTDGDLHQTLMRAGQGTPAGYEQARRPYFQILRSNDDLIYVYTVVRCGAKYCFGLDAELPRPGEHVEHSGLMQAYRLPSGLMKDALARGVAEVEHEPYTDEYGTFLSGYAPLRTSRGQLIGVVGVDMSLRQYRLKVAKIRARFLFGLGCAAVLSLIVAWFVTRLRRRERVAQIRYGTLITNMPAAVFECRLDNDLTITFVNRYIASLTGYPPEAFIGSAERSLLSLVPLNERQALLTGLRAQIEAGDRFDAEVRLMPRHPTASASAAPRPVWVRLTGVGLGRAEGGTQILQGFMQNITLRKATEAKVIESERQFRSLADSTPNLLWIIDVYGDTLFFNKTWLDYTGRSLDDGVDEGWLARIHPEDKDVCLQKFIEALAEERTFQCWFRLMRSDEEYRWMLAVCTPRMTASGKCDGYIAAATDITERKAFEVELKAHRDHLQTLVDERTLEVRAEADKNLFLRTLIVTANSAGDLTSAVVLTLDEICRFTGWGAGSAVLHLGTAFGDTPERLWSSGAIERFATLADDNHPETPPCAAVVPIHLDGGLVATFRFYGDGALVHSVASIGAALGDAEPQLARIIARFQQEAALRDAKDAAESSARAKSEFLSNMSHELRTPMHAILNYAAMARKRLTGAPLPDETTHKLEKYLGNIDTAGNRLLGLLNNLLDLAKMEAGRMVFHAAPDELGAIVGHALMELDSLIKAKTLTVECPVEVQAEGCFDRQKLIQVVVNLLSNAIRFSPPGSTLHLVFDRRATAHGDALWFALRDEGPGVPAAELDHIFEPFIQSSDTRSGAGGTGLGLSICREIIAAHGGRIWAENVAAGGAVFAFEIPCSPSGAGPVTRV